MFYLFHCLVQLPQRHKTERHSKIVLNQTLWCSVFYQFSSPFEAISCHFCETSHANHSIKTRPLNQQAGGSPSILKLLGEEKGSVLNEGDWDEMLSGTDAKFLQLRQPSAAVIHLTIEDFAQK